MFHRFKVALQRHIDESEFNASMGISQSVCERKARHAS
jgi:hypothetical protein